MKLALVLDRFDRDRGGLEHWAWQWTKWLLHRGHDVHVVASAGCNDLGSDRFRLSELGFAPSRVTMAGKVARHLETIDADLIHDLGVGWRYDVIQPQFGTRLADDSRNLRALGAPRRWLARMSRQRWRRLADIRALETRQYAGHPGRVVAVSSMTRDDLVHWHGISTDKVTVIHNGVDPAAFSPPEAERRQQMRQKAGLDGRIVLLFAAHNFRLKGLGTVLRALKRVDRAEFHLVVAGHGDRDRYSRLAERLGIDGQVTFTGFVPDIRGAYAMADAFVQPTFYDPCSLAILEAAASGLAVVTSRFNGASELFCDGQSASVVADPEDEVEAAKHFRALIDPHYRARLAAGGLAVARQATAERAFSRLFDLCVEVARQKAARPCRA
jgi:UDP-glucose:(heptosyl)LPS alpha-1,3-glucosyltransferase